MFNLALLDNNSNQTVATQLWMACLTRLRADELSTQLSFWLDEISADSLLQSHKKNGSALDKTSMLSESWTLVCRSEASHKLSAAVSHFANKIETICSDLCATQIKWTVLGSEHISTTQVTTPTDESVIVSSNVASWEQEDVSPVLTDQQSALIQNETQLDVNTSGIHAQLSFSHFVVGKANQLAHAAAQQVAMQPGVSYNPFFLYGGVGLGKTHLIHAIGNAVLANNPNARIRYIHANQFVADVVSTIRRGSYDAFNRYYHSLDVLLIDDIQFFANKKRTQEEFFYAFEALVANRRQIVLTSDTYPKEMADIESRLISRFNAGLIATIEPPELEMRVAILQEKAKLLSIALHDDVAFYIAKNLRSNVRELEGALNKINAYSRFQNCDVSLEMAKNALRDVIGSPRGILSVESIQKVVADYYKVKVSDLYGKRRLANIVLPRQVAMYLTKEMTQRSLPDIGEAFGGRDHTTVLYAVKKIARERLIDSQLKHHLHVIEQTLTG